MPRSNGVPHDELLILTTYQPAMQGKATSMPLLVARASCTLSSRPRLCGTMPSMIKTEGLGLHLGFRV